MKAVADEEDVTPAGKKKVKATPPHWRKIADEMVSGSVKQIPPPKKTPAKPIPDWKKIAAAMAGK